ncbi:TolC family protein [Glaciimonas immobilis]|uniref:Protein CyaE n=1 Tax=Glaciimonas immobilis TaxID=728004 RepID=A0A840RYI6_9BURK|nr:TolC family protein [Glaciimonas immobilis]KAF3997238.1 TolC family protein [Glaciimonas immobilis]MBB5202292.1 outer membrane protein [Glaciimonas immobilis]
MKRLWPVFWLLALVPQIVMALNFLDDPFNSGTAISTTVDKNMAQAGLCGGQLPPLLTLVDAVSRALCSNPQTKQSWSEVKLRAARIGSSQAAYLPTVEARGNIAKSANRVTIPDFPAADSTLNTHNSDVSLSLNWVLYDFGLRAANLTSARELLNAAVATQDDVLQTVFLSAVSAFDAAQAAQARLIATQDAEQAAAQSLRAAAGKYAAGAGTLADRLQAQTAAAASVVERMRAGGDWQTALGGLASVIGLRPDTPLHLAELSTGEENTAQAPAFEQAVGELIEMALRVHPKILAAAAQLRSAQAQVAAARAQGKPTVSLFMSGDRSDTPIATAASRQVISSRSIGIQLNIPLLDGVSRHYQVRAALAQVEGAEAALAEAQRLVALEVWNSAQSLHAELENATATGLLMQSARQSMVVAQGRYKAGIGTMLELLKAQSELAASAQQRILALTRGQTARLRLAASLARLRVDAL